MFNHASVSVVLTVKNLRMFIAELNDKIGTIQSTVGVH